MTRDYSRREFVAGCGCAGAGALLAGNAVADSGDGRRLDPPPQRWNRTYEGAGDATTNAVVGAFDDNGFVFAGARDGEGDSRVAWLYKVDATGELAWEQTYSLRPTTVANDVIATEDGYALAGVTNGPERGQEGFVVRVDPDGAEQWRQSFHRSETTDETVAAIVQRPDNGFVCAGRTTRFDNAWVQRLGSDGAVNQGFTYDGGDGSRFDGVVNHPDGGFFLAGSGMDATEDLQGWIMHIDDGGQQQWASSQFYRRESGNVTNRYNDYNAFYDVVAGRNGFFLVGATGAAADGDDRAGWVMEVNNTGVKQTATTVTSDRFTELTGITSGELDHYAVGRTATNSSGVESQGIVAKIDLVGEVAWSETYSQGTASSFRAAALGEEDGVVLAGNTASSASGDADGWSVKLGGPVISTPTPTPSPTPTPTPSPTESLSPTVSPSPQPPDTPTSTPSPTATPTSTPTAQPTTAPSGPSTTTADTDEGSGPPLAMLGVGFVIVAIGVGGFLYNQYFRGDDDGDGDGTIAGPGPATGGSAPLTDDGTDGSDDTADLTPASDVEADEEVTGAQTIVEKPDAGDSPEGESSDSEPTSEDAGGDGSASDESDATSAGDTDQSGAGDASDAGSAGAGAGAGAGATATDDGGTDDASGVDDATDSSLAEGGDTETTTDPDDAGTVADEGWGENETADPADHTGGSEAVDDTEGPDATDDTGGSGGAEETAESEDTDTEETAESEGTDTEDPDEEH